LSSRHYSPSLLWISIQRWNKLIIGEPLEFGSIANDRAGWLQIVQSVEYAVRNLAAG
jgi:hypothetical protein